MTSPPPPTPASDLVEARRRRALRCMLIALAATPVSFGVLALLLAVRVPEAGVVSLTIGCGAQLYYGLLAIHLGLTTRDATPPDQPRPRGALAAVIVGLLLVIASPITWLYMMVGMMFILGAGD